MLAAQAEPTDKSVIAFYIAALEVIEQTSALRDHLEQAAPRVVIFLVCFEMLREFVDALCEQSDLHLRRPRIPFVGTVFADDSFLHFFGCRHCFGWPSQTAVRLYPQATARVIKADRQSSTPRAALSSEQQERATERVLQTLTENYLLISARAARSVRRVL